jgi:hypothetical protein
MAGLVVLLVALLAGLSTQPMVALAELSLLLLNLQRQAFFKL